jgi:hypothetical protein
MPRPPILPLIDWKNVFENGKTWEDWLNSAESGDQATRMRERYDALAIPEECEALLQQIEKPVHVVAIAEDWCGDVIRHAPVIHRIATNCPQVQVRYIARNDHPDLFARFLTNGGEAIPKFIFLSDNFVECGNWGPMSTLARQWIARGKACGNTAAGREKVREHYQSDPGCKLAFEELCALAELAGATCVE